MDYIDFDSEFSRKECDNCGFEYDYFEDGSICPECGEEFWEE